MTSAALPTSRITLAHAGARAAGALLALVLAAFLVVSAPLNAHAHDELTASNPADGAVLDALPAELTLTFSAELLEGDGATEVAVTDPAGTSIVDGSPVVEGEIVTQAIASEDDLDGTYTVLWKVVSSDGHPISGEFTFVVGQASSPSPDAPAEDTGTSAGTVLWIVGALLVALVLGAVVYLLVRRARQAPQD